MKTSGGKNKAHEAGPCEKVLVLGDSALTPLGCHFPTAIDLLCGEYAFDRPVEFENLAAVGFTSADALWCLAEYLETHDPPSAVIIYLGNCDACAYGPRKPRAEGEDLQHAVKKANEQRRNAALFRRNPPFAYLERSEDRVPLERSVTPEEYAEFISEMIGLCHENGIEVILVDSASKPDFPPCNNTGNFLAYRLCGSLEDRGVAFPETRGGLARALASHQTGDLDEAERQYREVLQKGADEEVARLCAHNLAVLRYEQGEATEALAALEGLGDDGHPLNPLNLYCRAVILESLGRSQEALEMFESARAHDWGTYRVTPDYSRALAAMADTQKAHVIGQGGFTGAERFVDYCHPDEQGHRLLAKGIRRALGRALGLGDGEFAPRQAYLPYNPDSYAGARRNFFEHYGFVVRPREEFAEQAIALARELDLKTVLAEKDSFCPDPARRAQLEILAHPLFGEPGFLGQSPPALAMDQGSLPNLYFIRHLAPLYQALPGTGAGAIIQKELPEIMPRPGKLSSWLPLVARYAPAHEFSRVVKGRELNPEAIAKRARLVLSHHLMRGAMPHERLRGISYWFFRESMWFGSSSHWSMLFNRLEPASVVDAAAYMMSGLQGDDPFYREFENILRAALAAFQVHKKHLAPLAHRPRDLTGQTLDEYDQELKAMGRGLERSTAGGSSIELPGGAQVFPERAMASSG